jgi:protein-disulfide isomerase
MNMAMELYKSDMYKDQQKSTLEQILGSMDQDVAAQDTAEDAPALILEDDKIINLIEDEYVLGNEDARITIIEYSEFICPFCKRHYNDQTLENLVKKYPDDVNMIFKQFPIAQLHPTAPLGAQGAVCA